MSFARSRLSKWVWPCFSSFILLRLLFCGNFAVAQSSTLNIEGINLTCPHCAKLNDKVCRVKTGRDNKVMTCDEGLLAILSERVKDKNIREKSPLDSRELLAYLRNSPRNSALSTLVLENMLLSDEGQTLFLASYEELFLRYESSVAKALQFRDSVDLCKSLWLKQQPSQTEALLNAVIPVLIDVCTEEVTPHLTELLVELPPDLVVGILDKIILRLVKIDKSYAGECSAFLSFLKSCSANRQEAVAKCKRDARQLSNKKFTNYAEHLVVALVIKSVASLPPQEALIELADLNFREAQTEELRQEVGRQLIKFRASPVSFAKLVLLLRDGNVAELLDILSARDEQLRELVGLVYLDLGLQARKHGDEREAVSAFVDSSKYLPLANDIRDREVLELSRTIKDEALREQLRGLLKDSNIVVKTWIRAFALCALAVVVVVGFWQLSVSPVRRLKTAGIFLLTDESRQQLREDLRYFGLNPFADEESLASEFRKRAKRSHPDLTNEESAEFREVKMRYERALRGLRSRNHTTEDEQSS